MHVIIVIIPVTYCTEIRPLNDSNFTRNHFCYLVVLRSSWFEIVFVVRRNIVRAETFAKTASIFIILIPACLEPTVHGIRSLHFAASDTTLPPPSTPRPGSDRWINYVKSLGNGQTGGLIDGIIELNERRLCKCFVWSSVFGTARSVFQNAFTRVQLKFVVAFLKLTGHFKRINWRKINPLFLFVFSTIVSKIHVKTARGQHITHANRRITCWFFRVFPTWEFLWNAVNPVSFRITKRPNVKLNRTQGPAQGVRANWAHALGLVRSWYQNILFFSRKSRESSIVRW